MTLIIGEKIMPTYLKHYYVDPVTGEAFTGGGTGMNGKAHPNIPNLDVKFWFQDENGVDVCYSMTDVSVNTADFDGVSVLTKTNFFNEIETHYQKAKAVRMLEIHEVVKTLKHEVVDKWWHSSEISAAIAVKTNEAQAAVDAVDDATADAVAPYIALEAKTRKVSTKTLASRILSNSTSLMQAEAIISGHRGFLTDTLSQSILFDGTDIDTAMASFAALSEFDVTQGFDTIRATLGV